MPGPGAPSEPDRLDSPFLRPNLALPESESLNFSSRRLAFSPNRSMPSGQGPPVPSPPGPLQRLGGRFSLPAAGLRFPGGTGWAQGSSGRPGCPAPGIPQHPPARGAASPRAPGAKRGQRAYGRGCPVRRSVCSRVHSPGRPALPGPRPPRSHTQHGPNFSPKLLSAWPDLLSGRGGAPSARGRGCLRRDRGDAGGGGWRRG